MNILLLGSGGREDALAWRLRQSPSCGQLLAAPGNPGIARWAECVAADPCDPAAIVDLARAAAGPISSSSGRKRLWSPALPTPCARPALPCSARMLRRRSWKARRASPRTCAAPTASRPPIMCASSGCRRACGAWPLRHSGRHQGRRSRRRQGRDRRDDARGSRRGDRRRRRRAAGDRGVPRGEEASLFALVDGETAVPLASAQDHKRVGEGDTGPNTGGMGAYAPAPVLTPELQQRAMDEIVRPTARALAKAGTPFSGVLYAGLMLTSEGPKLIEYNVRFGDPECEAIMPLIEGDFAELLHAVATGRLGDIEPPRLSGKHAMTVIVAARGYPGTPASGGAIANRRCRAGRGRHRLSRRHRPGRSGLVAKGGRVLAVTAVAETSPTPARGPIALSTRSTSPTDSTAATSAGASWSGAGMNAFWSFFWPMIGFGLLGRDRRPDRLSPPPRNASGRLSQARPARAGCGGLACVLAALLWTGPLGGADRFVAAVDREVRSISGL